MTTEMNPNPGLFVRTETGWACKPKQCPECKRPFVPENPDIVKCPECVNKQSLLKEVTKHRSSMLQGLQFNNSNAIKELSRVLLCQLHPLMLLDLVGILGKQLLSETASTEIVITAEKIYACSKVCKVETKI
jgi:hypothetical protein